MCFHPLDIGQQNSYILCRICVCVCAHNIRSPHVERQSQVIDWCTFPVSVHECVCVSELVCVSSVASQTLHLSSELSFPLSTQITHIWPHSCPSSQHTHTLTLTHRHAHTCTYLLPLANEGMQDLDQGPQTKMCVCVRVCVLGEGWLLQKRQYIGYQRVCAFVCR